MPKTKLVTFPQDPVETHSNSNHSNPIPKYDPSYFHVSPADAKGVSYRLTFRVPPELEKSIDTILSSKLFPFSTRGDVLRWAVKWGLKELEQLEPVLSVTKKIEIMSTILQEEASHSDFMAIFSHLEETVSRYMGDQAPKQAMRVVALAKAQFQGMPEGHWRERYLEELGKRFGHLLQQPGMKLYEDTQV